MCLARNANPTRFGEISGGPRPSRPPRCSRFISGSRRQSRPTSSPPLFAANYWSRGSGHDATVPLIFKVTGVWGNHEGSMLLWALILAIFGALVALFGDGLPPDAAINSAIAQGGVDLAQPHGHQANLSQRTLGRHSQHTFRVVDLEQVFAGTRPALPPALSDRDLFLPKVTQINQLQSLR